MGVLQKILYFIGGKPPEIIFRDRQVFHEHPAKKWDAWKDRFKGDHHDWRKHSGKVWEKTTKK